MTAATDAGTRAELLESRAAALPALERRAWSVPMALEVSGWSVVLVLASGLPDVVEGAAGPATAAVLVVVALWRLAARVHAWRSARAEIEAWRRADRSVDARSLPAGDVDPALRTPYDARDDADLDQVLAEAGATATGRVYDLRLLWFGLALVPAVVMWIVCVALAFVGESGPSRLVAGVAAVLLGVAVGWLLAGWQREAWHRQQALNSSGLEKDVWRARQALLRGEPLPGPGPVAPLAARIVLALVFLAIVGFVGVRVARASGPALLVVAVVLLALVVPAAVGLVRRRALHVVPLLHGGDDVLSSPWHPVTLERDEETLTIRSDRVGDVVVPSGDVLGVVPVSPGYAFAPETVAVVRRTGEPVVLAGRGAADLLTD